MEFINLTPYPLNLGCQRVLPPTEPAARCLEITLPVGCVGGVPLIQRTYGGVTGLPEPQPETLYIVSALVRLACPDRLDIASPGDVVRDGEGRVLGTANLIVNG